MANKLKPIYMPENCIFYLKGTRDIIKKYYEPKPRFIQGVQKCRATDNTLTNRKVYNGANNAVISYRKKADISNINPKMVSISFWFKRDPDTRSFQELGFGLGYGVNFGFSNHGSDQDAIYYDDNSMAYKKLVKIEDFLPTYDKTAWSFYTFCIDEDGRMYISVNGKQLLNDPATQYTYGNISSFSFSDITLFCSDGTNGASAAKGLMEEVIIHRGVCLYKEDFEVDGVEALEGNIANTLEYLIQLRFEDSTFKDIAYNATWDYASGYENKKVEYSDDTPFPGKGYKSVYNKPGNYTCIECKDTPGGNITLEYDEEFTISYWENKEAGSYKHYGYTYTGDSSSFTKLAMCSQDGDSDLIHIDDTTSIPLAPDGKPIPINQWTHRFITYKNGVLKTFSDGKLVKSITITKKDSYLPIPIALKGLTSFFFIKGFWDTHHYRCGKLFDFVIVDKAMDIRDGVTKINKPKDFVDDDYFGTVYLKDPTLTLDYIKIY